MGKVNYAAIDIGSNAVRLLIKNIDREAVQEKKIKKVMMLRVPLRLGFDVFSIGELSEKKADKLRRLMKAFRQLMKFMMWMITGHVLLRLCGTRVTGGR